MSLIVFLCTGNFQSRNRFTKLDLLSFQLYSDPPLSEEDIPAGLWLCHMCQMLKKQRALNATKTITNDDESSQSEMHRIKDSRPSTPITSDGVINAAKVRLNHKRSLSRVSSSSDNSLSSDREIRAKISRIDSDQSSNNSNGIEISSTVETNAQATENTDVNSVSSDVTNVDKQHEVCTTSEEALQSEQSQSVECSSEDTAAESNSEEKENCETTEASSEEVITEFIENPLEETKEIAETQIEEKMETNECPEEIEKEVNEIPSTETNGNDEKPPDTIDIDQNVESQAETQPETDAAEIANDNDPQTIANNDDDKMDESEEADADEETTDFKSPFEKLIRAASILNPRQFELPRELAIFPQFPGDEKG